VRARNPARFFLRPSARRERLILERGSDVFRLYTWLFSFFGVQSILSDLIIATPVIILSQNHGIIKPHKAFLYILAKYFVRFYRFKINDTKKSPAPLSAKQGSGAYVFFT
jgi:hypothetical protein